MLKLPLRKLYFIVKLCFLFVLVLITLSLFEFWRGGKRSTRALILDEDEELYERQILEDEARIIPGLGEGGRPAYLTGEDKRLGEEAEKKYAVNTYLSDRIAYNRTLNDFRNPACERVTYDAELPSTSVIIIFHNEPYSVVIRTIWSVLNTARRDQPWHRRANYLERGTGRVMKLGYPGQPEDSEHVYLKEIILVDDNSTLPELRGKLARYVRTRLPPDMVRILRLPDRVGLTRARHTGVTLSTGDILIFLDSHCEGGTDWLRPLLYRIKHNPKSVLVPVIDMIETNSFAYNPLQEYICKGLMMARVTGARAARGEVLVFLDAHCEAEKDWLRPLLQRISHKRDTVPTPVIDVIDQTTFHLDGEDPIQVGGFTFVGHFTWIDVPEREKKRRGSDIAPTWSPTMAGGLFAIRRSYYWELGAYDEQMAGWGGENLEMSFRIWQCGGTLETIPCSRVGHVFRSFHPYGLPANSDTHGKRVSGGGSLELLPCSRVGHIFRSFHPYDQAYSDSHGINTARMAEVWMDEYAELFYLHRPDLRKNPKIGDVTHRKILREKLHCKSFQWFLDNVYQEKYVPVRDSLAYGRVQNKATHLCLDTMQREGEAAPLGFYPCHSQLTDTQYLSLSLAGQLRDEERCADVQFLRNSHLSQEDESSFRLVVMTVCRDRYAAKMQWRRLASTGQLQHVETGLCLDARGARAGDDARARPCELDGTPSQRWAFDYDGDESHAGVLPAELEQRLSKIKGQRRKSRSLLSVSDEDSPAEGGGEGEGVPTSRRNRGTRRRRRRSKKKQKIHKNKFIVTVERTLPNSSVEHLEMDIHCKHKRLYPNNSFVRDLVSILNDRDIRVINNGRVFEKNKVTDLKEHLRQATEKTNQSTTEKEDESLEASTQKPWSTETHPPELDNDVVQSTTEYSKPKKRHHKKHGQKHDKKHRPLKHSLLLGDESEYRVAIGSGTNGTGALLRAHDGPPSIEHDRETPNGRSREHLPWPPSEREFYVATARPDSSELRLSEDLARGTRYDDRDRIAGETRERDRIPDTRAEADRHSGRIPGDTMDRGHGDNGDRHGDSGDTQVDVRAREAAIARHAEVYEFKKVTGERARKTERRGGKSRAQVLSENQGKPYEDRETPEHAPDRERPRHTADTAGWGRDTVDQNQWDPWGPSTDVRSHVAGIGGAGNVGGDTRKALPRDPHDVVDKLVFNDVWEKDARERDPRVSDLAKQVMMEYDELTEKPLAHPRAALREGRLAEPSESLGRRGKALRLRLKSNVTFNLGDELLNWRRMQMGGPESESESLSDEDV